MLENYKYWAFISYSHKDEKEAIRLHKYIERYKGHRSIKVSLENENLPKKIFPIFRDRDELSAGSDLTISIQEVLKCTKYLIVICSPNSAKSKYVNEEIYHFKYQLNRENRILPYIIAGEPNSSSFTNESDDECFPKLLRYEVKDSKYVDKPINVLAADIRKSKDGFREGNLKIISRILNVNYDALRNRDLERRKKYLWIYSAISLALIFSFVVIIHNRNTQKTLALINDSLSKIELSNSFLNENNPIFAIEHILRSLPNNLDNPERPILNSSIELLNKALSRNRKLAEIYVKDTLDSHNIKSVRFINHNRVQLIYVMNKKLYSCIVNYVDRQLLDNQVIEDVETKNIISNNKQNYIGIVSDVNFRIMKIDSFEVVFQLDLEKLNISSFSISDQEELIAVGYSDGSISLYNTHNKSKISLNHHKRNISDLSFSPNGQHLASGGYDGLGIVTTLSTLKKDVYRPDEHILAVSWNDNSNLITFGGYLGKTSTFDIRTKTLIDQKNKIGDKVRSVLSNDGNNIVHVHEQGLVVLWRPNGLTHNYRFMSNSNKLVQTAYVSNGSGRIGVVFRGGSIEIFDISSKRNLEITRFDENSFVLELNRKNRNEKLSKFNFRRHGHILDSLVEVACSSTLIGDLTNNNIHYSTKVKYCKIYND